MKALTYHGPHHVKVENVPDPGIEQLTISFACYRHRDLRIDLHLYRGKIHKVKHGDIFGHEFVMGEVVETGRRCEEYSKGIRSLSRLSLPVATAAIGWQYSA